MALNVKAGEPVWDQALVEDSELPSGPSNPSGSSDPHRALRARDGGPIVAYGQIIVGLSGCSNDYQGGCFIVGLDATTGHEDWRFNAIARPGGARRQ